MSSRTGYFLANFFCEIELKWRKFSWRPILISSALEFFMQNLRQLRAVFDSYSKLKLALNSKY